MTNFSPSYEDIKIWMIMADTNKDGKCSLEEYEAIIIKSLEKVNLSPKKKTGRLYEDEK